MENTVYARFRRVAEAHPSAPAVIENDRRLTFADLSAMTDALATAFPAGLRAVGVVMSHRAEMIAAMLAILKTGAMYVPAEPTFPVGRIHDMMTEAGVDFVLTDQAYVKRLPGLPAKVADCLLCEGPQETDQADYECQPQDLAYVLYTSGTTGRPKGVSVTNANVCHYARAFHAEFDNGVGDIMLQYSVCSFDIFVEEVFASLLNGAAIAIPSEEDKKDIRALMAFVNRHRVTMLSGFPYLLAEMNHLDAIPASLRLCISGGDVLRGAYVNHLLGQTEVYNTYGPSETTVCCTYYRCNDGKVLDDGTYPVGHPVQGAQVVVMDVHTGQPAQPGQTGELCILGDGVSQGYLGDHDEENKAFATLEDGRRMYHSGDLGYTLPDGSLGFLHRMDTQVMIMGKRVETMEVESRLYQCTGVDQALVRAYTDEKGLSYMVAYLVAGPKGLKLSTIREELAVHLTPFMIPEFFVQLDAIPLNANGKPDTSRLPVVLKEE